MIVVDASVLVALVAEDGKDAREARERLAEQALLAPELADLEVASAVRRAQRMGRIGQDRAIQALADLASLPIWRVSHAPLLRRIWALRDNLTPYDAAYVALAEALRAQLLTRDARLARAPGIRCEVVVLS
jgi:predicted nucleic acid-binding protein